MYVTLSDIIGNYYLFYFSLESFIIIFKWQDLNELKLAAEAVTYFATYIKICSTFAVQKKKYKYILQIDILGLVRN